ncbi:ADP-ribosylation factor-binding protein GGA2-like isoform X3 [Astyanax mexicanus]|uniref:ADP-ribosylation factor-binding protein GGA2-like isoform X3 n=1 Tax=Astyanax mexicanus TaxID=7994 RepID=UPI0020CB1FEA|nr:ADP-ribosylation factor-binding protein GGA2-like isoform X3 [Astyanax mexicanus]
MAADERSCSLESLLSEVTDPNNVCERWNSIQEFYQHVNTQENGPQVALRLLVYKIQSPQEREALQALTLLEACMNNCGKRFHSEATKFRFLNELIKVLSPKYLGTWSSAQVKQKVTEVLFSWTQWLKEEPKVQEAYHMLKKQGIVKSDPKLPDSVVMPPLSPRQEVSVFDDEDKEKLLSRLLKSGRHEDLETANRLIKSAVKEEQEKMERESRRIRTLQEVEKCTSQLRLLLNQRPTHTAQIKDLYERCDRLRPNLFRLASDTTDNDDDALAGILKWNDDLTEVMNLYRQNSRKQEEDPVPTPSTAGLYGGRSEEIKSYMDELVQLEDAVSAGVAPCGNEDYITHNASALAGMSRFDQPIIMSGFPKLHPLSSLANVTVPLDSIKPSGLKPITLFDRCGVRVSLHFTKEAPPSGPDVATIIISAVNTSALPVSDFLFLAAVPKVMQVKLQPATRNVLPPYRPLLPPAALSQILLLSNPLRRPVRVRFRLSLKVGEEKLQQEGEIDQFPEWSCWTKP